MVPEVAGKSMIPQFSNLFNPIFGKFLPFALTVHRSCLPAAAVQAAGFFIVFGNGQLLLV